MRPIDIRKLTKRDSVNTDYRLTIDKDNNQCLTRQPDKSLSEDELKALPVRDALVTDKRLTLDSTNNFVMTNQPDNSAIGTAASKDTGTLLGQIPLNSDLGTAATKDVGTLPTQLPTNGDLGTASVVNVGTAQDQIETNALKDFKSFDSLTSAIAYVTANPDNIKRLDTSSYRSSAECTTLGINYPDGGAADYVVVAGGAGAVVQGYWDAGSVQLQITTLLITPEMWGAGAADDTTSINNIITYSIANNLPINGNNKEYTVTGNIPDLHNATIYNATITRGTDTFHTSNKDSDVNVIYVSLSGSASNDGITAALPMLTAGQAFGTLDKYELILDGYWKIEFAAGTYDQTTQATYRAKSKNRVLVYGPNVGHPNIPTAIFDGGSTGDDYTVGWYQTGEGTLLDVADVKFIDFSGDPAGRTRGALICDQGGNIVTHNVHAFNCTWYGIYISFMSRARIRGGILDTCREAINTNNSQVSIASTGDLAGGTIFKNSIEKGVHWSRSTQGHVDDCTFEDNVTGIVVAEGSRVDAVRNDYKRNGTAVSTTSGGMYGDNPNAPSNFNAGTGDANGIAIRNKSGGLDYNGTYGDFATSILRVNQDRLERSPTAVLTKQVLSTLWTMPAPWLDDIYKEIRIKSYIRVTSALVGASVIAIDLGAGEAIALALPSTAVGGYVVEIQIHSNAVGAQKSYGMIIGPNGTTRTTNANSAVDTTLATDVNLAITLIDVLDQPKIKVVRTTIDALG